MHFIYIFQQAKTYSEKPIKKLIFKHHNPILKQKGLLKMQSGYTQLHKRFNQCNIYIKIPTNMPSQFYDWMSFTELYKATVLHHNHRLKNIQNWLSYLWNSSVDIVLWILPFPRDMFWRDMVVLKGMGHAIKTNMSCEPSFVT